MGQVEPQWILPTGAKSATYWYAHGKDWRQVDKQPVEVWSDGQWRRHLELRLAS